MRSSKACSGTEVDATVSVGPSFCSVTAELKRVRA